MARTRKLKRPDHYLARPVKMHVLFTINNLLNKGDKAMKNSIRTSSVFCVVVVLSMITVSISMADESKKPDTKPGWVVIEEDIFYVFDDEPSAYFYNAHESFMKRDLQATAPPLPKTRDL